MTTPAGPSPSPSTPAARRLALLFVLLALLALLAAALTAPRVDVHHSDFFAFWLAGKMTWLQADPYDPLQWTAGHEQFAATWKSNDIFAYPRPLTLLLAPFGLLQIQTAYFFWILLVMLGLLFIVYAILRVFLRRPGQVPLALPLVAAVFLFRPTLVTIYEGQLSAFLLFVLAVAVLLFEQRKYGLAAVALSFLALKPPIAAPILFLLVAWFLFRRLYKPIAALLVSGLAWLLLGLLQDPRWVSKFLGNGSRIFSNNLGLFSNTWGVSARLCAENIPCTVGLGSLLSLLLLGLALRVIWRRKEASSLHLFSLVIPVSLVITPYIWPYDHILLILPILHLALSLYQPGRTYLQAALVPLAVSVLSFALLLLAVWLNQDTWSVLLPVSVFLAVLALPPNLRDSSSL